jgi:ABC-type sugar transport system permease subunit
MAAATISIVFWATHRAFRQIGVGLAAAAWLAMTVVVMIGNLRVVDDLVQVSVSP